MRVDKPAPNRTVGQRPQFIAYVVEGEQNEQPGMVRAMRFDKDGGAEHWLDCTWTNYVDDMGVVHPRSRLAAYQVHPDQAARGAFLLRDEYERIGRLDLFEAFDEYQQRHEPGQYWPDELLPPRVRKLQKMKGKRASDLWDLPDLPPIEGAENDDDGPSLAANLDAMGPEEKAPRTSGRRAKA